MNTKNSLSWDVSRIFFLRTEPDRIITLSMLFSGLLVLAGIIHTHHLVFMFLVWNLFLAWLPYALTKLLASKPGWLQNKMRFALFFLVWLLCIPNSFYILTDLYHLGDFYNDPGTPSWYDLAVILSFAWNGLLLGIVSVRQMEKLLHAYIYPLHEWLFLYPVMWLNALGVYTGRYLRFNSWDVLTDPFPLMRCLLEMGLHPIGFRYAWGMIFCFSVMMTLMYLTIKKIATAFF